MNKSNIPAAGVCLRAGAVMARSIAKMVLMN